MTRAIRSGLSARSPGSVSGRKLEKERSTSSAWDRQATWYDGWVGGHGSRYHQRIVLPVGLIATRTAADAFAPGSSISVAARFFGDPNFALLASARSTL